jgi:SAM-dependent methyltransferase
VGILAPVAEFILAEHRYRAITGNVLFVGRQTTFLDQNSLSALLAQFDVTPAHAGDVEFDTSTWGGRGARYITDRYFMKTLGIKDLRFVDVSDYEGADIVADLGYPVDSSLHGQFDFIYNGGCLDNMFNPHAAMVNLSKMLKPGGRVVCMESGSSFNSPYLMFSPAWFFDYYVTNGFSDCKVYVCSYKDLAECCFGPWDLFYYEWFLNKNGPSPEAIHDNHLILLTIAEKSSDSTSETQPIQFQYRNDPKLNIDFEQRVAKFADSPRPLVNSDQATLNPPLAALYGSQQYLRPLGRLGAYIPKLKSCELAGALPESGLLV